MPEVELPDTKELEEIRGKGFTRRVALTTAIFEGYFMIFRLPFFH